MAIKVNGTTVIDDSRVVQNVTLPAHAQSTWTAGTSTTDRAVSPADLRAAVPTANAALGAGVVGTYMWATSSNSATVAFGSTRAGSELKPTGAVRYVDLDDADIMTGSITSLSQTTAQSGTWRCMGWYDHTARAEKTADYTLGGSTLWLRIS